MKMEFKNRNLINFKTEFIVAGPRNSVVGILNILTKMSCEIANKEQAAHLLNTREPIVLLCINEGVDNLFATVKVLSRNNWWDYYHNKKKKQTRNCIYPTYNSPKQNDLIFKLLNTCKIELLIPEEV